MDENPFFEFSIVDINKPIIKRLEYVTKNFFDIDKLFSPPEELNSFKELVTIGGFDIKNEIATNIETGLMWLRFGYGQSWRNDTAIGDLKWINWENSFSIVKLINLQEGYAGYTDWRLPTIEELRELFIKNEYHAYINDIFPNCVNPRNDWYWSSTPFFEIKEIEHEGKLKEIKHEGAYGISFKNGSKPTWVEKYEDNYMRLVRSILN